MPQVALLHGYFDESGKWADKDTISFCGLISDAGTWELFAKEWWDLLEDLGLDGLHTSEFVSLDGRYAKERGRFKAEDIEPTLLRFVDLIQKYANGGYGIGVDTKHFKMMKQSFQAKVKNPHFIAFKFVMNMVLREVEVVQRMFPVHNWRAGIICDQDPGTSEHCLKHFNKLRTFDKSAKKFLNGICFADSIGLPPLQAADLLAYVVRIELERRRTGIPATPSVLYERLSFRMDAESGEQTPFFRGLFLHPQFLDELAEGKHDELLAGLGIEL